MLRILHTEIKSGERLVATDITDLTFFPKGTILTFSSTAWSATSAGFKDIWKICNAANHQADPNNVPDLTDRFLRGGTSSDFTTGGGADNRSVTLTANNLPSHSHGATGLTLPGFSLSGLSISGLTLSNAGAHTHTTSGTAAEGGSHSHTISGGNITGGTITAGSGGITGSTGSAGSSQAFIIDTVPAYYTVIYIIKVA
ncbi:hypothetical protein NO1_1526 [Candidatus Termititenax aidoneus]|uniref:Phage tail fiber protein n=1 Tax=Termititenax aidoneus TaxID=2218524 RepID=A0A388TCH5_TERA1|nr:hypothetical protein NO1_1526 [Candidatus Termititenax aidoneus]